MDFLSFLDFIDQCLWGRPGTFATTMIVVAKCKGGCRPNTLTLSHGSCGGCTSWLFCLLWHFIRGNMFSYQVFIKCLLYVVLYELYFEDSNPKLYLKNWFYCAWRWELFLFMGWGETEFLYGLACSLCRSGWSLMQWCICLFGSKGLCHHVCLKYLLFIMCVSVAW